jgi:hypothetical protein
MDLAHEKKQGSRRGGGRSGLRPGSRRRARLIGGAGLVAIPGIGPFIAGGPIMGMLNGLGVGGTVGGIAGALIGSGIPEYEAKRRVDHCYRSTVVCFDVVRDFEATPFARGDEECYFARSPLSALPIAANSSSASPAMRANSSQPHRSGSPATGFCHGLLAYSGCLSSAPPISEPTSPFGSHATAGTKSKRQIGSAARTCSYEQKLHTAKEFLLPDAVA